MSDADESVVDRDVRELVAERVPVCDDCGVALVPGEERKHVCGE